MSRGDEENNVEKSNEKNSGENFFMKTKLFLAKNKNIFYSTLQKLTSTVFLLNRSKGIQTSWR